jgi:hypothetical protein
MRAFRTALIVAMSVLVVAACGARESTPTTPGVIGGSGLVLSADGIGSHAIGDDADEVIDGVSAQIGGWDSDSLEPGTSIEVPACGGGSVRQMSWGNLVLTFVDTGTGSRLFTWAYGYDPVTGNAEDRRGLDLRTDSGVRLGTPRSELERIHRGEVSITDDASVDIALFTIDGDEEEHLSGRLGSTAPDAAVQFLERIPGCEASA